MSLNFMHKTENRKKGQSKTSNLLKMKSLISLVLKNKRSRSDAKLQKERH